MELVEISIKIFDVFKAADKGLIANFGNFPVFFHKRFDVYLKFLKLHQLSNIKYSPQWIYVQTEN